MPEAKQLAETYSDQRGLFEAFTENVHRLVDILLKDAALEVFRIESRTKTVESVRDKCSRDDKHGKYKTLSDLTDLCGVRVITYLQEDGEKAVDLLKASFAVDSVNSVDKQLELGPDRFGYQSVHIVLSYSEERVALPEFSSFKGMKVELQVKTILQHAWAAIDWKMRYKNTVEAPKKLRRRLYRISALLEAADDEFSYVSMETASIRKTYEDAIERGDLAVGIDRESVEAFITAEPQAEYIREATSQLVEPDFSWKLAEEKESSSRNLVKTINTLGITSLDALKSRLAEDKAGLPVKVAEVWKHWGYPSTTTTTSTPADIVKLALVLGLPKKAATELLAKAPFNPEFGAAVLKTIGSK